MSLANNATNRAQELSKKANLLKPETDASLNRRELEAISGTKSVKVVRALNPELRSQLIQNSTANIAATMRCCGVSHISSSAAVDKWPNLARLIDETELSVS